MDPTDARLQCYSAFGPFIAGLEAKHTYNDVLPSANLKIDLTQISWRVSPPPRP